jgi:lipoprotein-releasing system permease protein
MGFEGYIARRYFRSGRFFTSISTWISTLGVMLGVAVVCIVMSAHNGFESEIRNRLLGTMSNISIFSLDGDFIRNYDDIIQRVQTVPGVVAASPFILYKAAISSPSAGDGIVVRGIDPIQEQKTSDVGQVVVAGEYTFKPIAGEAVGLAAGCLPR